MCPFCAPPIGAAFCLFVSGFFAVLSGHPVSPDSPDETVQSTQTTETYEKKHISFSWSAGFHISTNGSDESVEEKPHVIVASGTGINGTLNVDDFLPRGYRFGADRKRDGILRLAEDRNRATKSPSNRRKRDAQDDREFQEALRDAKADHDKNEEHDNDSEDEFQLTPEMKVKIYSGVILGTIFLVVFVMCIWPLFKCCRTCCQVGTAGCLACWDLIHCRDPGYRLMCLAAKQAGLDPPTPEEYDNFMSGWSDQAPELMEALMQ